MDKKRGKRQYHYCKSLVLKFLIKKTHFNRNFILRVQELTRLTVIFLTTVKILLLFPTVKESNVSFNIHRKTKTKTVLHDSIGCNFFYPCYSLIDKTICRSVCTTDDNSKHRKNRKIDCKISLINWNLTKRGDKTYKVNLVWLTAYLRGYQNHKTWANK